MVAFWQTITAEILNAYTDEVIWLEEGRLTGEAAGANEITITATVGENTATATGPATTGADIAALEHDAIWAATIGTGEYTACQLGRITRGRMAVYTG